MPAPSNTFPIQEPLRTKEECQYARNLIGYLWKEHISKGERLVLTIDRQIEGMTKGQRGGCMLWFDDMAKAMGVTPRAARSFCMSEWFSPVLTEVRGQELIELRSFGDLDKTEVMYLMESMEAFCAEEGIPLRVLKQQ